MENVKDAKPLDLNNFAQKSDLFFHTFYES